MLAKVFAGTIVGLEGVLVEVEVDVSSRGLPNLIIVGLPDKAVDEARDRVKTAIINSSYEMPDSRITVNLAPADIPKEGSSFDLPIALGILTASKIIQQDSLKKSFFVGELSLEGIVRRVPGAISLALLAKEKRILNFFVPEENAQEATLINGVRIYPVKTLQQLIEHLKGEKEILPRKRKRKNPFRAEDEEIGYDLKDISGQKQAKRAIEIVVAGFHNIHLKGPPGTGKTMLCRAIPSLFPSLTKDELLEVSKIHSALGILRGEEFALSPPFRSPHHTTSRIGLIGGGPKPRPGEISLAHRGVLFLDEFSEFPRSILESLRQPLEDGFVSISRAAGSLTFPSRFLLVAASNPCPCGYLGHPKKRCKCSPASILKYKKRLSGPILDRIDIHADVPSLREDEISNKSSEESSHDVRKRIIKARKIQKLRFKSTKLKTNSDMSPKEIRTFCRIEKDAEELLKKAMSSLFLSARAYFKTIKVARTIADLEEEEIVKEEHVAEALQFRSAED